MSYQSGELQPVTMHLYLPHKMLNAMRYFYFQHGFLHFSNTKNGYLCNYPKKNTHKSAFFQKTLQVQLLQISVFRIFLP